MSDLWRVIRSMQEAADQAGVALVTGDTKVVDRGKGDQIFINTSGVGLVEPAVHIHPARAQVGDKVLINGPIAVHGIAIMSVREGLEFETEITSDTAPLNSLVQAILGACKDVHVLRDPDPRRGDQRPGGDRRAGAGWYPPGGNPHPAQRSGQGRMRNPGPGPAPRRQRRQAAGRRAVRGGGCRPRRHAQSPARDGKPRSSARSWTTIPGLVTMKTAVGGSRVVDMLSGEQLPRIC